MKRTVTFSIILILLGAIGTSCLCARPTPIPTLTPVPDVVVDGAITYQTIDGFGACGAFRAASHIHGSTGLSPDQQKAVLDLTSDQAEVVIFKFIEGLTNAQVAEIMGKTEGAVKSLQYRALASLRKRLESEDKSAPEKRH